MMRWLRRRSHHSSKSPTARRRLWRPLHLEFLEDRRTPAFGFLPGPDVTYHGGPLLQNVQVQAVYDGSAWETGAALQQEVGQLDGFLNSFVGSPYMDVLRQYN